VASIPIVLDTVRVPDHTLAIVPARIGPERDRVWLVGGDVGAVGWFG
jgi:hypothetical protein